MLVDALTAYLAVLFRILHAKLINLCVFFIVSSSWFFEGRGATPAFGELTRGFGLSEPQLL